MLPLKKTCLLAVLMVTGSLLYSQPASNTLPHEVRIGIGFFPALDHFDDYGTFFESSFSPPDWFLGNENYAGARYRTPAFTAEFHERVTKWYDIGITISYANQHRSYYDRISNSEVCSKNIHHLFFMLGNRFTWKRSDLVSMYSALNLGVAMVATKETHYADKASKTETELAIQLTLVGITVGHKLYGFGEFGVGNQGVFKAGVGYRF